MRVLRRGMKGDDVGVLQAVLNGLGNANLTVDNYFGGQTEAALKVVQKEKGLVDDGVAGPKTYAALGISEPTPVSRARPDPSFANLTALDAHLEKGTAAWYQQAYLMLQFDSGTQLKVQQAAKRVLAHKSLYTPVEQARGIPWAMIALIHSMECSNNPNGCLQNGELIIGTKRKTTIVPIGEGPFATFYDSAIAAIDSQALWRVPNWSVGYMLKQMEAFNGLGYLQYHHTENSPYLWACTNINDGTGKYVRDGKWDPNADANVQVGAAAILTALELMGEATVMYA